jgi:hypothetical protein
MMPTMGNLTLVVAVVSYAGQLNLTAVADRDGCPDLEVFAQGVRATLDDLAAADGLVTVATRATSTTFAGTASPAQERSSHVGSAQS